MAPATLNPIFGLLECHKQPDVSYKSKEARLFHFERRDSNTLLPIIRKNVAPGSMVWSDEWPAYRGIGNQDGLFHETVNHSVNFITVLALHTQNIERMWEMLKLKLLRNMKGTIRELLESHLDEFMWKSRHQEDT